MTKSATNLQSRDSISGINTNIDNDGPFFNSNSQENQNPDGTSSSSSNTNAGIPGGPFVNLYDEHHQEKPSVSSSVIPSVTPTPSPTPTPSSTFTPTPTPTASYSPPPPPPVIDEPEPEEPVGECPVEDEDEECPCEERFSSLEEKLARVLGQLDEMKKLQVQVVQAQQ